MYRFRDARASASASRNTRSPPPKSPCVRIASPRSVRAKARLVRSCIRRRSAMSESYALIDESIAPWISW